MTTAPRILLIRLSSLGDILHALPAFADLRKSFPGAKIDWLVGFKHSFLLSAVGGIDEIHVFDGDDLLRFPWKRSARSGLWQLIMDLRSRHYDYSIDFQGLIKTALLGVMCGSGFRIGFSKNLVREPPAHWFYHQTLGKPAKPIHILELNRMLVELVGARPTGALPELRISPNDSSYVNSLLLREGLTDFVVLNPGGGWPSKRWPPARYGVLAARIESELGLPVVITTGPGEESFYSAIARHCPTARHFRLSFLQLVPLLKRTRLFVGGDTGPFHLACALGTATVGIFGPTSPIRNGPWTHEDKVVFHTLECSFCYQRSCPAHNECMDISVDEVFKAVTMRLDKSGDGSNARS